MSNIGDNDYRSGALDRLEGASHLLREERFAGSVYLAGRAVEGMLRAIIWRSDHEYATGKKSLETDHNLRDILKRTRRLGILQDEKIHDEIANSIQTIARLWWNNMRFLSSRKIEALWYELGEVDKKHRMMKRASRDFYDACFLVVRRCEAIWQQQS